jgi:hypothetical protein
VRALHDLLARWLVAGERDRSDRSIPQDELPVVYVDGVVPRVLGALATAVVASAESRQVHTCAELIRAFAGVAPRLRDDRDRAVFDQTIDSVLPAVIQHAEVPTLKDALAELEQVLNEHGHDASRVAAVRVLLSEATRRLLPKASDEPEAAHPR